MVDYNEESLYILSTHTGKLSNLILNGQQNCVGLQSDLVVHMYTYHHIRMYMTYYV